MADNIGVPLQEFVKAVVDSYQKGFSDAIECLKVAQTTIDPEKMKESILKVFHEKSKTKAGW